MAELLLPWEPSPAILAVLVAAAAAYLNGARRTRPHTGRQVLFWIGMLLFWAALQTHADYYAEHAFAAGQVRHVVLHHMAPFFIVLSRPGDTLIAGLPAPLRPFPSRLLVWPPLAVFGRPAVAGTAFCALIVVWLVPSVHFYAMLDSRLYRLMTVTVAVNGLMFWQVALHGRAPLAGRLAMLVAVIPPQIMAGVALALAGSAIYPLYSLCGLAFGLTAVDDQRLGGVVLWLSSGMMSGLALLIVLPRLWRATAAPRRTAWFPNSE